MWRFGVGGSVEKEVEEEEKEEEVGSEEAATFTKRAEGIDGGGGAQGEKKR